MRTFTLDANCVIDLDEDRPAASHIRELIAAHEAGRADVAIAGSVASERQPGGGHYEQHSEFTERLARLGLDGLDLLNPVFMWDVTYWDECVWPSSEDEELLSAIHQVLCPGGRLQFPARASHDGGMSKGRWVNTVLDSLALWCHIKHKRDVFVSSDRGFHKEERRSKLASLGAPCIEYPEGAASLLR